MKTFVVFLASVAVLCSAASVNNDKSAKNHQKRGVGEIYAGDFGGYQSAAFGSGIERGGLVNLATPLLTSLNRAVSLSVGGPLNIAIPNALPAPHGAPLFHRVQIVHHGHTDALPIAHHSLPIPHQNVPVQFRTVVKNVPVPYERHIPIDNPIYTPVERHIPIDNPVPVVKYVTQPVPIHVEQQVHVPVIKEERIPEPYVHKVRLVIQRVFVEEPPQKMYLPPPPRTPAPVYEAPQMPAPHYGAPPVIPNRSYIPPASELSPNYLAPQDTPNPSYIPPFRPSPPAPPSTNYGVPQQHAY